jgi:predicted RNA-binding Zn-ribbon protein involved in translation (DUF1610 family)
VQRLPRLAFDRRWDRTRAGAEYLRVARRDIHRPSSEFLPVSTDRHAEEHRPSSFPESAGIPSYGSVERASPYAGWRRGDRPPALLVRLNPMEHSFPCPHCGEEISMVLDLSVRKQTYVEDCEVCCQPIEITYSVTDDELAEFSARTLG